jgi:hypothetical protein
MAVYEAKFVQLAIRVVRILFWVYRKLGVQDFVAVVVLSALSLCAYAIHLFLWIGAWAKVFSVNADWLNAIAQVEIISSVAALFVSLFYALRLRRIGIVSADAEIERGLDYAASLNKVTTSFDFIGIGAAKLTRHQDAFTNAVERAMRHSSNVRLVLCDPRSPLTKRLEQLAGVSAGKYLINVKSSFAFLEQSQRRFGGVLQIRTYKPQTEDELVILRLMLIDGRLALVSPNVPGLREGKSAPQLHLASERLIGTDPTLYAALRKQFEQLWLSPATTSVLHHDYREIEKLQSA